MKKHYSAVKPYYRVKRPYIVYHFVFFFAKMLFRPKLMITEPLVDEPVIYLANHANAYGPSSMIFALRKKRKFRSWSAATTLFYKDAPNHMMKTIFPNVKKPFSYLVRLFTYVAAPVLGMVFRASGVIPVYRDMRIKTTFTKTFESIRDGYDIVVFPDSLAPNPDNIYIDKMQKGAFRIFEMCRKNLDYVPTVYPVYCCRDLNTVCIGKALHFDTTIPVAEAEEKLEKEVGDEIKRLGDSLPPHKITHYATTPKNLDSIKKYMLPIDEKLYAHLKTKNTEEPTASEQA